MNIGSLQICQRNVWLWHCLGQKGLHESYDLYSISRDRIWDNQGISSLFGHRMQVKTAVMIVTPSKQCIEISHSMRIMCMTTLHPSRASFSISRFAAVGRNAPFSEASLGIGISSVKGMNKLFQREWHTVCALISRWDPNAAWDCCRALDQSLAAPIISNSDASRFSAEYAGSDVKHLLKKTRRQQAEFEKVSSRTAGRPWNNTPVLKEHIRDFRLATTIHSKRPRTNENLVGQIRNMQCRFFGWERNSHIFRDESNWLSI